MRTLVIDIGTSGLRAAVITDDATVTGLHHEEFAPSTPAPGLVEFDAEAMWDAVLRVATAAMAGAGVDAVGITNQRASTVGWRRSTGRPIGPAIGWQDLRTVGDYLEFRFGVTVRSTIAALLWVGALFILAGQLIAVAWILTVAAGLPKLLGCVLAGALITAYFAAGGLLTSAYVNIVQLVVKIVGFAIAIPYALAAAGGWDAVRALQPAADYWNPWQGGASGLVYLAMLGPAFIVSPGLLQKVYGARDDRAVRLGVGFNALALVLYAPVPVLLGMMARAQFPDLAQPELALPTLLMQGVPAAVGALGLAAVFSAELSAADAVLFILTTSLAQDFYKRFVNPQATDAQLLRVTRLTAVLAGTLGVAIALVAAGVVSALSIFYTIMGVSLFIPILGGLASPRVTSNDAMAAILAGMAVVGGWRVALEGRPLHGVTPAMGGLAAAVLAFALSHAASRARR